MFLPQSCPGKRKTRFYVEDLADSRGVVIAIESVDSEFVKGRIIRSSRTEEIGSIWWTTCNDLQTGLLKNYFDISLIPPDPETFALFQQGKKPK